MTNNETHQRIKTEIESSDIVLFMKGSADFPMCGFSSVVVQVLNRLEVPFKTIDVMQDQAIRQGIKEYSDWPTIPQLYIKQEFIGGCDIVKETYQSGELKALLKEKGLSD